MLFWLECLGVARDSIALKTPKPSMGDAEGVGPVEMATHIVQSIRLQLTQPTHGPYLRTALKCKRHLEVGSICSHLMYGHCDSHNLSHREYFAVPPFQCGSSSVVVESRRELLLGRVRKSLLVRLRLIYNSFIIRISLSFWLTVRRKKRDRKVFAKHFPLILAGTMRTWVIRPRDKKIAKNAAKTALLGIAKVRLGRKPGSGHRARLSAFGFLPS